MRRLQLVASLVCLSAVVSGIFALSEATASHRHPRPCFPHGAQTIALNRHVRVYSMPEYVKGVEGVRITRISTYASLLRRGTRVALEPRRRRRPRHALHDITLARAIVAFVDSQTYDG